MSLMQNLDLDKITPAADQPRKNFDAGSLLELAMSIRERGVLEPIVVRPISDGKYEIVMGERRWRASQLAGLSEVPAIVRDLAPDVLRHRIVLSYDALSEGITTEDLLPGMLDAVVKPTSGSLRDDPIAAA